jgi:DNA mismatch repair protein MSH6
MAAFSWVIGWTLLFSSIASFPAFYKISRHERVMKERKTLFDYFKLPLKKPELPKDTFFSDGLEPFDLSSSDTPAKSDFVGAETKRKKLRDEDSDPQSFLARGSIESPFGPSEVGHEEQNEAPLDLDEDGRESLFSSENRSNARANTGSSEEKRSTLEAERFSFLVDVRDKNGLKRGEEGYDPSTLHIPESAYRKFTPFEKQFWDIKKNYFDAIVFFKKGKFYELYEDDAEISAKLFDLKVTDRVNMKMTGFPEGSFEYWAKRFLERGFKIARVDQSENMIGKQIREKEEASSKAKIINRELKEVITQGTIYNLDFLPSPMPVYVMAAEADGHCYAGECDGRVHLSVLLYDASTSDISYSSFCDDEKLHKLRTILSQHEVKEVISSIPIGAAISRIAPDRTRLVSDKKYSFSNEREYLCYTYLHNYMKSLKRENALNSARIREITNDKKFMVLDDTTLRNMEIFRNNYDKTDEKTLFKAINFCTTPFGQRLLRRWVMAPLMSRDEIVERQKMAQLLSRADASGIKEELGRIGDAERLLSRLNNGNPTLRDLRAFLASMEACGSAADAIIRALANAGEPGHPFLESLRECGPRTRSVLEAYLESYRITESEIEPGAKNADELCALLDEKRSIEEKLDGYLKKQRTVLGCRTMKFKDVGREVFQIEVPKDTVLPSDYFILSTTKTTKRFYSRELKALVNTFLECEERIFQSQGSLLRRAVDALSPHTMLFYQVFSLLAHVDCYLSFNTFASRVRSSLPVFSDVLSVAGMTNPIHPDFVPNDYVAERRILVLTGPNMGGKSTFLRSMCLNIILSQIGMGVCCDRMGTPIFDRIFTRIGASDNLLRGESTFMVELSETSSILRNSTERSFIVIDELGRGTSTRDGECIARAVLEYLKTKNNHVLFSTHYHKVVGETAGVANGYMSSTIKDENIVFLYKLVDGLSLDSHGLYVARMAGVPESVVKRASEIKHRMMRQSCAT